MDTKRMDAGGSDGLTPRVDGEGWRSGTTPRALPGRHHPSPSAAPEEPPSGSLEVTDSTTWRSAPSLRRLPSGPTAFLGILLRDHLGDDYVANLRAILRTAVPTAWATACQVVLMLSLSMFAGRISLHALAAVGLNEIIILILSIHPAYGLCTGGATRMAHAVGSDDHKKVGLLVQQTGIVVWGHAVLVTPLLLFAASVLQRIAGVEAAVAELTGRMNYVMAAYPLVNASVQLLTQYLVAIKHANLVSIPNLFVIALTPLLLFVLVEGSGLGVEALGIGWLFALVLEGSILYAIARYNDAFAATWVPWTQRAFVGIRSHARDCLSSMVLIAASWSAMEVVFLYMATYLSSCELATSAVVHQTRFAFFILPGALCVATGVSVAHAVGERNAAHARRIAKTGVAAILAVLVVQSAVVLVTLPYVPRLFSSDPCVADVYRQSCVTLVWEQCLELLLLVHLFVLRSLHRSALAVFVTVVTWWVMGFVCVLVLGQTVREQLRMNVGFVGVAVGQLGGLGWTMHWMWASGDAYESVWQEAVSREVRRHSSTSPSSPQNV